MRAVKRSCRNVGAICIFLLVCLVANGLAKDPEYPTKPIQFIITFGAGGPTDLSCRALVDAVSKYLPKPVVPVNKPGASGVIGTTLIKESMPDGYTIGSVTRSPVLIIPFLQKVSYDTLKDFTPIIHYGEYLDPLMVKGDKPWTTWKELIEWGKKNPGAIKVGITGAKEASVHGLVVSQIESKENIKLSCVPFKSALEIYTALLGGNIDLSVTAMEASAWDFISTGKFRILSYCSKSKLPVYENIPSTYELYGMGAVNLMGIVGPKGIPPYIARRLEDAFAKAIKEPTFTRVMEKMYSAVVFMSGEDMGRYIEKMYKEQSELIERFKTGESKK